MSHHHVICKNCENHFNGHFCNNCGQKANTHRIDLHYLLHGLFHAFTHVDKGFPYTIKMMLLKPGKTLRGYLAGRRVDHPNPLMMLLIVGGLCSLIYYRLELKLISSFSINELDGGIQAIDSKFFAFLYIAYSLIFALIDYFVFRYKKFNYIELVVINIFICVVILIAQLCLVPVWLLGKHFMVNEFLRAFFGFVFMSYLLYVRYHFFEVKNDEKSKPRFVLSIVIFMILSFILSWKTYYELIFRIVPDGWLGSLK